MVVDDLYRPYRPKRRTRATIAKEKGLEPLANIIMLQMTGKSIEEEAQAFVSEEKEVATAVDAITGAKDIIAEHISDEADYRIHIRDLTAKKGTISSTAKDPEVQSVYEMYYEFEEPVKKLAGHRVPVSYTHLDVYKRQDGDYLNIYKTENTKIDNRAQFWFDPDEGGEASTGMQYLNRTLAQ